MVKQLLREFLLKESTVDDLYNTIKQNGINKKGYTEVITPEFELRYDTVGDRLSLMWVQIKSSKYKGVDIIKALVKLTRELGLKKITTYAVSGNISGSDKKAVKASGYYALLKFGFIPDGGIEFINKILHTHYKDMQQAYDDVYFLALWKAAEHEFTGDFDVSSGSISMRQLNKL